MIDDKAIVRAARQAVAAWREWMGADGAFPEPEYDIFAEAMDRLDDALHGEEEKKT